MHGKANRKTPGVDKITKRGRRRQAKRETAGVDTLNKPLERQSNKKTEGVR
jgi:hypothetical protein